MGQKKDKLSKDERQLMSNWKSNQQQSIKIDFIVYIPGHLMAGSISECGKVEVSNKCPHMTLLLKGKASAVESNFILEQLL
ncbi:MAG: hypothetical protein KDD45_11875 [Bdellovibrionales bacterium]|nr:hypothetical protein [Bdellovibrionales bacterium]